MKEKSQIEIVPNHHVSSYLFADRLPSFTSRKEMEAGSSWSRYECVLAQRRVRVRALLLQLRANSNFSCSEPGGDEAW